MEGWGFEVNVILITSDLMSTCRLSGRASTKDEVHMMNLEGGVRRNNLEKPLVKNP